MLHSGVQSVYHLVGYIGTYFLYVLLLEGASAGDIIALAATALSIIYSVKMTYWPIITGI